jgi:hypothetical protein
MRDSLLLGAERDSMRNIIDEITKEASLDFRPSVSGEEVEGLSDHESASTIAPKDYIKWVQRSLNRLYGINIRTDGTDSDAYRRALRKFNNEWTGRDYDDIDERTQNQLILANEGNESYVKWVISSLNQVGLGPLPLTDTYTSAVVQAVKVFQRSIELHSMELEDDGFVGSKTELALIRATGKLPPGRHVRPERPKPDKPEPGTVIVDEDDKPCVVKIRKCVSSSDKRAICEHLSKAVRRTRKAVGRFRKLASMRESDRAKAWNSGPEKFWFGPYEKGIQKTPFSYVKNKIEIIHQILSDPRKVIIVCDKEEKRDIGWSYPSKPFNYLNPKRYKVDPPPYRIHLGGPWFKMSTREALEEWQASRTGIFVHEAAHYAGANRLLWEYYRRRKAARLAARNAWGARVNAGNYEFYVMSLGPGYVVSWR